jgi:hypothetical protein
MESLHTESGSEPPLPTDPKTQSGVEPPHSKNECYLLFAGAGQELRLF